MVPAAVVDQTLDLLAPKLARATSSSTAATRTYSDDIRRAAAACRRTGIHYVDVGTSGGVWGLERGYCLMIGGETRSGRAPRSDLRGARARDAAIGAHARTARSSGGTAEEGYLHCGPARRRALRQDGPQRHRVRPHGGLRRGLQHPRHANVGKTEREVDAETTPLRNPEHYQYDFDLADIAEVWRRGSVVSSWLLDLTATALLERPDARELRGPRVRLRRGPLDDHGRDRRGRAGARAERRAVRALRLARRGRLRGQGAVGDALSVRRPPRATEAKRHGEHDWPSRDRTRSSSSAPPATWPTRRSSPRCRRWSGAGISTCRSSASPGRLDARAAPRARARQPRAARRRRRRGGVREARASCSATSTATTATRRRSTTLRSALGGADAPAALPRDPAEPVRDRGRSGSAQSGLRRRRARRRREAVRPRPRVGAGAQRDAARGLPRARDLPHRPLPRQGAGAEPALLPLRQHVPRADLEPQLRRERADHDGRDVRRRRAAARSTRRPARSAT